MILSYNSKSLIPKRTYIQTGPKSLYGVFNPYNVLAVELTCSSSNKKFRKNSKTFQKILKFIGDEHIHVFYIRAKFCDEMTFLLLYAKKTNPVTKI